FIETPLKHGEKKPPITHPSTPAGETYNLGRQVPPLSAVAYLQKSGPGLLPAPATQSASVAGTLQNSLLTSYQKTKSQDVGIAGWYICGPHRHCYYAICLHHCQYALKTVQAFMILSIIFSAISLLVFVFQLFTMEKGNRFFLSGATMLVCWLCVLVGVSIYTNRYANDYNTYYGSEDHHGYSYILAWICFCFSFIIGVLYLVLRKK
uniref:Epithelial membrane protein 1 n=1 Tax=Macaca fascicularis TaxID=9541 RepID=A0A7N9D3Q4_MACFA